MSAKNPRYKIPNDIAERPVVAHGKAKISKGYVTYVAVCGMLFPLIYVDATTEAAARKRFHGKHVRLRLELDEFI